MASKFRLFHAALLAAIVALVTAGVSAQRPVNPGKSNRAPGRAVQAEKGITEAQRANVRERVALATRIVNRHQGEARALGLAPEWRAAQLDVLLPLSLDSLRAVEGAESLEALAAAVATEIIEPQSLGSITEDLVYKPVTPCRYVDTRVAGGKISGYRGYDLAVAGSTYGGLAGCAPQTIFGVDDDAIGALVMNVTVLEPSSAPGWLAVRPVQSTDPSALIAWATTNVRAANQAIVTPDHQAGVVQEFWIQTSLPAHVVVDISGAFLAPAATALDQYVVGESETCASGADCSLVPTCPAGYRLTGGGLGVETQVPGMDVIWDGPNTYGGNANEPDWYCRVRNNTGGSRTFYCFAVCSRTPGR